MRFSALCLPLFVSSFHPLEVFWPGVYVLTVILLSKLNLHVPQELSHVLTPLPSSPHHSRENYSLQFPPCIVLTSTYKRLNWVFSRARSLDPNRDSYPKLSLTQVIRIHNKNFYKMIAILYGFTFFLCSFSKSYYTYLGL